MKYLPFLNGTYSTAPGLTPLTKTTELRDRLVFQIDESYDDYLQNKRECRKENIHKYFCTARLHAETERQANLYIAQQLLGEHPEIFHGNTDSSLYTLANRKTGDQLTSRDWVRVEDSQYESLFDALCSQVQEDIAIFQLHDETEYLAAIHLCAPNHWSPGDKVDKAFHAVHAPVPGMERTLQHYFKMLTSIVNGQQPFTRFAWGIATDTRLNHHPEPPPHIDASVWHGRAHDRDATWYIRTERQNLIGLPEVKAFIFTIRTYFYPVDELTLLEKKALLSAVKSMSPDALQYKGLTSSIEFLTRKLG